MATHSTFGKQGVVLHCQAREIVANVITFMKSEAELFLRKQQAKIPLSHFKQRIMAATGISDKTYRNIVQECKDISSGSAPGFTTTRTKKNRQNQDNKEKITYVKDSADKLQIKPVPSLNIPRLSEVAEGTRFCLVRNCNSRSDHHKSKNFFALPTLVTQNLPRIALWKKAVGLDSRIWGVPSHAMVCSDHFVSGRVSDIDSDVDYVPSMKLRCESDVSVTGESMSAELNASFSHSKSPTTGISSEDKSMRVSLENSSEILEDSLKLEAEASPDQMEISGVVQIKQEEQVAQDIKNEPEFIEMKIEVDWDESENMT